VLALEHGAVVQTGTLVQLRAAPATAYVARFCGTR
jgi:ABC-type proline/glycine betaine transport system ATPase subunit